MAMTQRALHLMRSADNSIQIGSGLRARGVEAAKGLQIPGRVQHLQHPVPCGAVIHNFELRKLARARSTANHKKTIQICWHGSER